VRRKKANKGNHTSLNYNASTEFMDSIKKKAWKGGTAGRREHFFACSKLLLPVMRVLAAGCMDREMRHLVQWLLLRVILCCLLHRNPLHEGRKLRGDNVMLFMTHYAVNVNKYAAHRDRKFTKYL
jgi:hypothetical protein